MSFSSKLPQLTRTSDTQVSTVHHLVHTGTSHDRPTNKHTHTHSHNTVCMQLWRLNLPPANNNTLWNTTNITTSLEKMYPEVGTIDMWEIHMHQLNKTWMWKKWLRNTQQWSRSMLHQLHIAGICKKSVNDKSMLWILLQVVELCQIRGSSHK